MDQTLEQEKKVLKRHGATKCQGLIGLHHFKSRLGREVCWYHEDILRESLHST